MDGIIFSEQGRPVILIEDDTSTPAPGFWPSVLTADEAVAGLKEYSQLAVSDAGDLYWVEYQPEHGGRNAICCRPTGESTIRCLTPDTFSVRSRVHEYGGLSWCLLANRLVFVNAEDQQLWLQSTEGGLPTRLTDTPAARYGAPIWDRTRNRLIAIQELHSETEDSGGVINRLVAIDLASGAVNTLHEAFDFYDAPTLSPQGDQLAWIGWNHPDQPWTRTSLCLSRINAADNLAPPERWGEGEALTQPQFSDTGQLHVISDRANWWQICRVTREGLEALDGQFTADHCAAPWQIGQRQYSLTEKGWIAGLHANGTGWLLQDSAGALISWATEYSHFRSIVVKGDTLYCVASSACRLSTILSINLSEGIESPVVGGRAVLDERQVSRPEAVSYPVMNEQAHALLYPPVNADYCDETPPPLVIFLHGGPTSAAYPVLNPKIQYWTQRGFMVADLNYRGSTGFGRDYRMKLKGQWGCSDVEDAVALVDYLVHTGQINPKQVFIRGGSAGGFTALAALAKGNCFTAAASHYGVTDLSALATSTHKFESRYLDWLIGDPEHDAEVYKARSPIEQAADISAPVIFFQGARDNVVPPEQTEAMVSALRANDTEVEVHRYADEYHGFRDPAVQAEVLELELAFYQRCMEG